MKHSTRNTVSHSGTDSAGEESLLPRQFEPIRCYRSGGLALGSSSGLHGEQQQWGPPLRSDRVAVPRQRMQMGSGWEGADDIDGMTPISTVDRCRDLWSSFDSTGGSVEVEKPVRVNRAALRAHWARVHRGAASRARSASYDCFADPQYEIHGDVPSSHPWSTNTFESSAIIEATQLHSLGGTQTTSSRAPTRSPSPSAAAVIPQMFACDRCTYNHSVADAPVDRVALPSYHKQWLRRRSAARRCEELCRPFACRTAERPLKAVACYDRYFCETLNPITSDGALAAPPVSRGRVRGQDYCVGVSCHKEGVESPLVAYMTVSTGATPPEDFNAVNKAQQSQLGHSDEHRPDQPHGSRTLEDHRRLLEEARRAVSARLQAAQQFT